MLGAQTMPNPTTIAEKIVEVYNAFEAAFFLTFLYVAFIAPIFMYRGDADGWLDYAAGIFGTLFWIVGLTAFLRVAGLASP
jgi:hypothetical protein